MLGLGEMSGIGLCSSEIAVKENGVVHGESSDVEFNIQQAGKIGGAAISPAIVYIELGFPE